MEFKAPLGDKETDKARGGTIIFRSIKEVQGTVGDKETDIKPMLAP